jgi:murein DD-endopeptidase MepM/ murein hydrolase activator NlpD
MVVTAPATAWATDGSAETPAHGGAGYGELRPAEKPVDRSPGNAVRKPKPKPKPKPRATGSGGHPLLTTFGIGASRLYIYGRSARVSFQINDRSDAVAVGLVVVDADSGETIRTIDLGDQATGVPLTYRLTGREGGALPAGRYRIRVRAHDAAGHTLVRRARTSAVDEIAIYPYRFPLRGTFVYGDPGSRFGAPRSGHSHQGQDVAAPEGTQVRAARGGVVKTVAYQGSGAGHYIVIEGAGERRDYVYMHLQTDSIRVEQGQRVRTGAWIASVGNTGASFGAHLHFEIWRGAWYDGGEPIDPYPLMRRWDRWS